MLHLIRGEGEARATFRSTCVCSWLETIRFGRFPIDFRIFALIENWSYSKSDPNRCKSISIDRNVSYDTLLDAASATMLIVSSENYWKSTFRSISEYSHWLSLENIRKSSKIDRNRPKRRVMSHGHGQLDRNVARASPSPQKISWRIK